MCQGLSRPRQGLPDDGETRARGLEPLANAEEKAACYDRVGELAKKCVEDATKAIDINRHLAAAYLTRGIGYAFQSTTENSFADFTAAIREDSKLAQAYFNRGLVLVQEYQEKAKKNDFGTAQKLLDAAVTDFEQQIALQPNNLKCAAYLAQCYRWKNDQLMFEKYAKKFKDAKDMALQAVEGSFENPGDPLMRAKKSPELLPDSELEPVDLAKRELEKRLDATGE